MDLYQWSNVFRAHLDMEDLDSDRPDAPVMVMTSRGKLQEPLSLSWNDERGCWLIVCVDPEGN